MRKESKVNFPFSCDIKLCVFNMTDQKPDVMYADIGGMDIQKQEVREAVELPLTHFELYKQVSIEGAQHGFSIKLERFSGCCDDQRLIFKL